MSTVVDECKNFIKEIRLRPALWDKNDADYGHRESCELHWEQISEKFNATPEQVKIKWRGLRDSFRRNLRREISFRKTHPNEKVEHRWRYFVPMLFLKSQLVLGKKSSSMSTFITPKVEEDSNGSTKDLMSELQTLETTYEEEENCNIPRDSSMDEKSTIFIDAQQGFQLPSHGSFAGDNIKPSTVLSDLLKSFQKDIIELEKEKANTLNLDATDDDVLFLHSLLPYFRALDMKKKLILRTKIQQLVCENLSDDDNVPLDHFRNKK